MSFGNPVAGRILENKAPWPGPPTFRVTSTFAQHIASGRGAGIDIGNQQCGAPVLAMAAGTVTFVGQLSTGIGLANVVRYRISATEELGAAHLATMTVANGQRVNRGDQIGTLGMTGADACHLHQGYKVNGVEQDWWPMLDQNLLPDTGMGDDVNLKGKLVAWINNRTLHTVAAGGFVSDPTGMPYNNLVIFPIGQAFTPSVEVIANSLAGTDRWYGGWISGSPPRFGYCQKAICGPLVPLEATGDPTASFNEGVAAGAAKALEAKK